MSRSRPSPVGFLIDAPNVQPRPSHARGPVRSRDAGVLARGVLVAPPRQPGPWPASPQSQTCSAILDGELVAFGNDGKPSFNALQNHGSSDAPLAFFVFDVLMLVGRDVRSETLEARGALLEAKVLTKLTQPARYLGDFDATARPDCVHQGARVRRTGSQAARQPVRVRPALRGLAEDARQSRTGVRHRRVHRRRPDVRCSDLRYYDDDGG